MILHAVYFSPAKNADPNDVVVVMKGLENLVGKVAGFDAFHYGPNVDAERKSPEADYGFHATFSDRAALDRYAVDPRHQALGARLVALCGGAEHIKVYDIDTTG